MTFDQLLNGIKGLECSRNQRQIDCFAEKIRSTWGPASAAIFQRSLMKSPDGNYYIPEQYDRFTIASLIAS